MENRAHALIAGLFVIILCATVVFIAQWFSGDTVDKNNYLVFTNESVSGLNPQASVHYRGVNIGKVESVYFNPENSNEILMEISADRSVTLHNTVFAIMEYQGLTGLTYIQLNDNPDVLNADNFELAPLLDNARIPMRRSFLDEMTGSGQDLIRNINKAVVEINHILDKNHQKQISEIITDINNATSRFDDLFDPERPDNMKLSSITTELDSLLKKINIIASKVNEDGGIIDSLALSAEAFADTVPKLNEISDGILRSTQNLDRTLRQYEDQPQSILFGKQPPLPGPGENGYVSPEVTQ
ncbi:MAG: MlaD family protein [Gammaproteobacteria bacterium]|nr:MlaD family protein [Gammaproteobacteria bacterium]